MPFSSFQRDRELAITFNDAANAITYPLKVRLHTGDPGASGTSNEVSTSDWTNYAPQTVNEDLATQPFWTAPAAGSGTRRQVTNDGDIDFGTATIVNPVTVTHVSVFDSHGTPKFVAKGTLSNSKTVNNLDPVKILDGELIIYREDA